MRQLDIPAAYRKIEYLEGTGTQYIQTNYTAPAGGAVEIEFANTVLPNGDSMIFGSKYGDAQCYAEMYEGLRWYAGNGNKKYSGVMAIAKSLRDQTIDMKYLFTMDSNSVNFSIHDTNHKDTATPTATISKPDIPIYIFAWNNSGSSEYVNVGMKLYRLEFRDNGTLSANFVPCVRKSDSKPGMYDTVSNTFYINAGTGEFVIPA